MSHLEIERKFLLKSLPKKDYDDKYLIDQYYWKNRSNIWERARTYHSEKSGDSYIHTVKKSVSKGVNMEDEKILTKEEYELFKDRCLNDPDSRYISKERYIYKFGDLKWEVDNFDNGYRLIVAELEIPKKTYRVALPEYISEVLLMEVTGLKQFSNRSLSIKMSDLNNYKNELTLN